MHFKDYEIVVIMMVLLLAFKGFELNIWKYDMLRTHHSRNYIRSNYIGLGEWAVFSKSFKEIGIILPIVNILTLLTFAAQGVVLYFSLKHFDVKFYIAVLYLVMAFLSLVTTVMTIHNYSALGIGVKGNRVNYGERVISALAFAAIVCFFAFMNCRGVLFNI